MSLPSKPVFVLYLYLLAGRTAQRKKMGCNKGEPVKTAETGLDFYQKSFFRCIGTSICSQCYCRTRAKQCCPFTPHVAHLHCSQRFHYLRPIFIYFYLDSTRSHHI